MDHLDTPERQPDVTPPTGDSTKPFLPSGQHATPGEIAAGAGFWLAREAFTIALLVAAFIWLYQYFGGEGFWDLVKAALGLGFVVFIHELGHFLVAKWCDVHVETFSIGFGPALPGCSFQWGETLYKIALFPLGGYVKMVGEGADEEDDDDPRSFKNKPVGQRMAIISAGVIMNVLLAAACFVAVYTIHGAERPAGVIALVDAGSPAWQHGVPTGSIIKQIGNARDPYFDDLMPVVATSTAGEKLPLVYEPPGQPGKRVEVLIEPRKDKDDLRPLIGVMAPQELKLISKAKRRHELPVFKASAAAEATPPFEFGDAIVGSTDPDHPDRVTPIPLDPHTERPDYFKFRERSQLLAGKPMVVQVRRKGQSPDTPPVDIQVPPAYHYMLGMRMRMGQVTAVRDDSPAVKGGVRARNLAEGVEGDILRQVEVTEPDGTRTRWVTARSKTLEAGVQEKDLDPVRLPDDLQQWAERKQGPREVTLTVLRQKGHAERQDATLILEWDDRWRFDREVPYSQLSPMPVPGLGLAYRVETIIDAVEPGQPAEQAGLKKGDVIKAVRFFDLGKKSGEKTPSRWFDVEADQWANIFYFLQDGVDFKDLELKVESDGKEREVALTAVADTTWPLADRGLLLAPDLRLQKANGFGEAVAMGMHRTWESIIQIYLQLRAIGTGRVSVKNLGGPIMIATAAYKIAGENIYEFLLFLGMISVNLAVINFLPIPVLDGGHMVFLVYEKLRGRPASEQVRVAATYAGLMLIASLMLFVIYLDVKRF